MQDTATARMLCAQCEQRFSVWESTFARQIFHPWQEGCSRFEYEAWLLRFVVSLAWRTLVTTSRRIPTAAPQHQAAVEEARRQWATLLLDPNERDGRPYRHNIFFGKELKAATVPIPKIQFYLGRAVDATIVVRKDYVAAYTKLPGLIFWSHIVPPDPGGWHGTKVGLRGTLRARGQEIRDSQIGQFLVNRVSMIAKLPTSEARQAKLLEKLSKDPDRTFASDSYRAHQAEMRLKYGKNWPKS